MKLLSVQHEESGPDDSEIAKPTNGGLVISRPYANLGPETPGTPGEATGPGLQETVSVLLVVGRSEFDIYTFGLGRRTDFALGVFQKLIFQKCRSAFLIDFSFPTPKNTSRAFPTAPDRPQNQMKTGSRFGHQKYCIFIQVSNSRIPRCDVKEKSMSLTSSQVLGV